MKSRYRSLIKLFLALVMVAGLLSGVGSGTAGAAAAITLSPASGTVYALVNINGTGFTSYDTIAAGNITFAGVPWSTEVVQLDICGNFNVGLRVPANAVIGPNSVRVITSSGTAATATFTVVPPAVTVSPSSGPPYTKVTITGNSFVPLDTVPVGGIKFDGVPWNTVAVPIDGSGRWTISLRVPLTTLCCGSKPILVTTSAGTVAPATFSITAPVVTLTPSSGPIGTKVTVCVTNMTPEGTVPAGGITFGGATWNPNPISVDVAGALCSTLLTVPAGSAGGHSVVVNDGHIIATRVFTITQPIITVAPVTAYKGETITVTGSGWTQRTPGSVSVTFGGEVMTIATPDEKGYFNVQFDVPLTAQWVNLVGAFDILGNTALTKTLALKVPSITLNPTHGLPGSSASVTGVGFQPYSALEELKFGNTNVLSAPVLTDEVGAFTATYTVPGLPPGGYTVTARVFGLALSTCFMVDEGGAVPTVNPTFPIGTALASISDKLVIVWGYEGGEWKLYDPNDSLGSTLSGLTSGNGYWIKITENCTLGYNKNLTKDDNNKGWNLIGW